MLYRPNYLFDSMVLVKRMSGSQKLGSKVTYYELLPFHSLNIDKVYNSMVTPNGSPTPPTMVG